MGEGTEQLAFPGTWKRGTYLGVREKRGKRRAECTEKRKVGVRQATKRREISVYET